MIEVCELQLFYSLQNVTRGVWSGMVTAKNIFLTFERNCVYLHFDNPLKPQNPIWPTMQLT